MKRIVLAACTVLGAVVFAASSPYAQESAAVLPAGEQSLEQQVERLTRVVRLLEDQLNKCAAKQAEVETVADEDVETSSVATNLPQPSAAHVPGNRYGGGFRMAPEQRLSCEDYSRTYFQRHPAMAKVCGITVNGGPAPATESAPQSVSSTAP